MVSDSITSAASIPSSAPNSRDFGKKKRANRSAKLKQYKLDARREQWLSQGAVKSKECKEELDATRKKRDSSLENSRQRDEDNNNDGSIHHESDSESPTDSPINSLLGGGGTDTGTNFIGTSSSSSSGSSVSGSSTGGCCSGSITEEEEEDGCLDDWEAVADALAADGDNVNNKQESEHDNNSSQSSPVSVSQLSVHQDSLNNESGLDSVNSMSESSRMVPRISGNNNTRAWRPDDVFRPQCLPNLAKQRSFPATDRHFGHGGVPWACKNALTIPSSCPICCEDLDYTDSNFLPCLCGFRLCLFCHKRILEEDGRCPGCRQPYKHDEVESETTVQGGSLTFRLARSCSMVARS